MTDTSSININISLQSIGKEDTPYMWKVYTDSMKPHIEQIWGWDEKWQKSDFSQSLIKYDTSIITCEGAPVGYVQFKLNNEDVYINMLILEAEYQNKGIGADLLSIIHAKHTNKRMVLKCFKINHKAYQFYLKNNFELFDEDENFYLLSASRLGQA